MRVPVIVWVTGHLLGWHHATFHLFTAYVFKLDGGMADVKVVLEHMVQLFQDACAL